ncbi:DNL-type zinc finger protein [Thelohanellus kitauei]|uniref:DNL-type zinc finger protein n=1 Tax=Thelohanellus kitauei TaxID=669202 RepID=A0A0C2MS76_THEKT|nr:DNL-type zinc finger protein [Thelohanellus kitauei]
MPSRLFRALLSRSNLLNNISGSRGLYSKHIFSPNSHFIRWNSRVSGHVPGTYEIHYTCNVCKDRSTTKFSKDAYINGVVILRCKSCNNLHLVADNLKWFRDSKINIKDIMKEKGMDITEINPDSPTVFDISPNSGSSL